VLTTTRGLRVDPQGRLFRLAPRAIAITAIHEGHRGWKVTIRVQRHDERWGDAHWVTHSFLSTTELVSMIDVELETQLGL
jgi:hypothetical protein